MPLPDHPNLEKRLYREDAYATLKTWIVHGDLEAGEKLRDTELAQRLGVSRTPVREALRKLEDEGLVTTKQHAWTRVAEIDLGLAGRIYPILRLLEPLALELSLKHLKAVDLKNLRSLNRKITQAIKRNDAKNAALHDTALHDLFCERCQNPELASIVRTIKTNHIRLEIAYWRSGPEALESTLEHDRVIDALEQALQSGNATAAKRELVAHWDRALKRWEHP